MALGADPHSYANFEETRVFHTDLAFDIDFDRRIFSGRATLKVRKVKSGHKVLKLDTRALRIFAVANAATGEALWFRFPRSACSFGGFLEVQLPASDDCSITIEFETGPNSPAIQWLEPSQTAGGKHPLAFTQCQAILARALFPCQDTPEVKMSFTLDITCPGDLVAVGSGARQTIINNEDSNTRTFKYEQVIPVMSYLVAIICGDLEERPVGPRSSVWAEPGEPAAAAQAEFDGVPEGFITCAEQIVGSKYIWGRYDVAVLPRSFAYGGMENPNVTFFSASLLAGDKSLMTTLAHEITHSWSGNLVTNARWKDFWLNEGFTRYIERRILGRLNGPAFRGLLLMVGYNDLLKTVDLLTSTGSSNLTALEADITGIDPDMAFSRVPYEKGSLFLHYLEQVVGGEDAMSEWLKAYIATFRRTSIQTCDFKKHFCDFFKTVPGVDLQSIDWEEWLHGEGMPTYDMTAKIDQSLLQDARSLADKWLAGGTAVMARPEPAGVTKDDLGGWRAQQVMIFLDNMINAGACKMSPERLDRMDALYDLTATGNVEVGFRWLLLCMRNKRTGCIPAVRLFLGRHGRGSYVKPLYAALAELSIDVARQIFDQHGGFYQTAVRMQIPPLLRRHEVSEPDKKKAKTSA